MAMETGFPNRRMTDSGTPACTICGMLMIGSYHTCGGTPTYPNWTIRQQPIQLYTIQCCPVCEGRGNVPAGFYSRLAVATDTSPETCTTCDGKGLLKVSMMGTVEKIS